MKTIMKREQTHGAVEQSSIYQYMVLILIVPVRTAFSASQANQAPFTSP